MAKMTNCLPVSLSPLLSHYDKTAQKKDCISWPINSVWPYDQREVNRCHVHNY